MVARIRLLALDIDGVLTDGTTAVNETEGGKRLNFQDVDAITRAGSSGLTIVLVTGEETAAVSSIARRLGIERVIRGAKDKLSALETLSTETGIPLNEFCYVGDNDRDALALTEVGLGLAPSNATSSALAAAHRVLSRSGGAGAVAEAIELLDLIKQDEERAGSMEEGARRIAQDNLASHQRFLNESLPILVKVAQSFIRAIRGGRKILLFGNGGSAADAQHVAGELVGRFAMESEPWPAIALTTDTSILTAVGNDWDFSEVFARQVRALVRPGDLVVGISTSGRSANVLRGLETGRRRGATTIGFTGQHGDEMAKFCELCFCAPAEQTARIQELHLLAWHTICELVEAILTVG